ERPLVLVEARHRLAVARLAAAPGDVDPAEVHLRPALADRELDRPPAEQVEGARVVAPRRDVVARVDGREPLAVPIEDEPGLGLTVGSARLEQGEMPGSERRPPPGHVRLARPEREVEPLAGLQEQTVEPVERDLRRLARRDEALPHARR